ncbi:MAG: hypothetical protein RBQ86_05680 [Candidatus Izemoplasmatales bacterium]|jgi:hypothetical protein|nr:hypothetical protein [Candidatus Izemoplasmatales bacterium]
MQNINLDNLKNPEGLRKILEAMYTEVTALRTLANELRTDHATFKTVVDELTAWAEALATKLNADAGVTDTNYDAVITADAPATITAAAVVQKCQSGR